VAPDSPSGSSNGDEMLTDELTDLLAYLDASPSPHHAVASSVSRLRDVGFQAVSEHDAWTTPPSAGYIVRGGALIAWRLPEHDRPDVAIRLVGAHTDSPGLHVKPRPDMSRYGWRQLGVEVYGGVLNNSWLDRDLGIAGRVVFADGSDRLVDVREPIARVPQLAVHLDRNVNDGGLVLDRQQHLTPVWGLDVGATPDFATWIAERTPGAPSQAGATWWELCLYDVQPAALLGADDSMIASGRLDNQLSCWAATSALVSTEPDGHVAMMVLNDHEEVGSASTTGASGAFLEHVLERLVTARGGSRDELLRSLARSTCISADNAHALHPNYPERHDHDHAPQVGGGPAIKVNANQRYATSADTATLFQAACEAAGVPWQVFVSRNNMPCGSTIGPLTSTRLGIATADVGVPQLSMHSARELSGAADPLHLARALTSYFAS
jgi:aspartyl aminopeptidase